MLNSSTRDIINTTKSLNVNKASYRARRCVCKVKISINAIDCHLANIINHDISLNSKAYFKKLI